LAIQHEILIQTEDARVRVMTLSPGETTVLHHHTVVTDHMVGLEGEVEVNLKRPDEAVRLKPGERCTVQPGRVHQVVNSNSTKSASYLLIQGVGRYDFVPD
jgi:mannose-6-phosphate isomerase-like protein (cupin superfamily)